MQILVLASVVVYDVAIRQKKELQKKQNVNLEDKNML
jgi:hypothetical protein